MAKKRSQYVTVGIPVGMIQRIDEQIADSSWGYTSRAEFVKDSVRHLLASYSHCSYEEDEER